MFHQPIVSKTYQNR